MQAIEKSRERWRGQVKFFMGGEYAPYKIEKYAPVMQW